MSTPQNSCRTLPKLKKSPLGPQKVKNNLKIKSKEKVRIEGTIEKKVVQLHEWTPKHFLNHTSTPKYVF